jgi:hypothetical protein
VGIFCPQCGQEVVVRCGSVGAILAEALRLRAELGSVGLTCEACGLDFLHNSTDRGVTKDQPDHSRGDSAGEVDSKRRKTDEF